MTGENVLRIGLVILAVSSTIIGAWGLFAPESFFDDFPGSGHHWVSSLPPYNEHLTRDYGSMNLVLAVVLAIAAATLSRVAVLAALLAVLVNGVPHFVFHAGHQGGLSDGEQAANLIALAMPIALASLLLVVAWRRNAPAARSRLHSAARTPSASVSACSLPLPPQRSRVLQLFGHPENLLMCRTKQHMLTGESRGASPLWWGSGGVPQIKSTSLGGRVGRMTP